MDQLGIEIETNKTVTVLGKTFNSEGERREYFRNELRKKLPDLKQLEGFPIGEDEDIINLSDPPYYTACPNPWLNDFIAVWEEEKKDLEIQGKRSVEFEVDVPYAKDVSESKKNPIYDAHSYHTKVPHPAIMKFILHYTQPGDIVFDGFAGTGMTGIASTLCGTKGQTIRTRLAKVAERDIIWGKRRFISNDLSPIATFINYCYNSKVDLVELYNECQIVEKELEEKIGWMYHTIFEGKKIQFDYAIWSDILICNNCSAEMNYWDVAIDYDNKVLKDILECPSCSNESPKKDLNYKLITTFDNDVKHPVTKRESYPVLIKTKQGKTILKRVAQDDLDLLEEISNKPFTEWIPTNKILPGDKTSEPKRAGIEYVHQYFTSRNLRALSILNGLIEKSKYPLHLKFLLTGMIQRSSLMNRIHIKNFFYGGGGWNAGIMKGTIHIPSIPIETSILEQFKSRVKSLINAKKEINEANGAIQVCSSTNIGLKDNSVDYIFTDPPFGANIMYSELNFIWESWLKVHTNNEKEAIENRSQKKTLIDYGNLMLSSFREFYRILKHDKWMTVEFSNTSAAVWNTIQNALMQSGFVIASVTALDKKQGGMRSISSLTGVRQDLIISCYKPSLEFNESFQKHQYSDVGVWDFVEEHLLHLPVHLVKENSTSVIIERNPKILFDRLIAFYVQRGLPVPIDAGAFQKALKDRFIERDGMFFTNEQVQEYDRKKAEVPNFVQLSILVSSEQDGVFWLKNQLQERPQTYQEIQPKWMQALAGVRKGDIIPELLAILQENFLIDDAGNWYVADPENEVDLEKLRTKRLLKQFEAYKEQAYKPKGKIKESRVEALRAGFKQCYQNKDFQTIVKVGDSIPSNLLMEDEVLLQFYDIASSRV
ncbi:DNA methyltransferase [Pontibacter lucknowensis]|uniref:DNA methylase n=1 Tax=Pontibacter lucknowensis TaxID=1077936 RepID=A0A1N6TIT6_9BACT|nr:DNA methyltransferase [Pontibacter lucknowensis]SIQ53157.1 DNA methylase [Pontibacter lucknowensis]